MRLNKILVVLIALALLGWGLGAEDKAVKIGVIDTTQALVSTKEGQEAKKEIESKARSAESRLKPKVEAFQKLQKEFQEMQAAWSAEKISQVQFDLAEQQGQLETEAQGLEQQFKLDQARLMQPIAEKLKKVIDEIGREKGYSLIIERQGPGVLYVREALDITDLAVAEFNKKD